MEFKSFQLDTPEGGTGVQYNIDLDTNPIGITVIQVHSRYPNGLADELNLEWNTEKGKFMLCEYYTNHSGKVERQFYETELSNNIVEEIITRTKKETPNFHTIN